MNNQDDKTGQTTGNRSDDLDEGPRVGFVDIGAFEDRAHLEMHQRHHGHHIAHVDLNAEEYTPEELARMLGTSTDVILHAARSGELKAERVGHAITCIKHADVVEWLRNTRPGA